MRVEMLYFLKLMIFFWISSRTIDTVSFMVNPPNLPLQINENTDSEMNLWNVSATCNSSNTNSSPAIAPCNCGITTNENPNLFYWSAETTAYCLKKPELSRPLLSTAGKPAPPARLRFASSVAELPLWCCGAIFMKKENAVYKRSCSKTNCGSCPSCTRCDNSDGCLNDGDVFSIVVTCDLHGYDNSDTDKTLSIEVTEEIKTLDNNLPSSVSANNTMSVGTVLATAGTTSGLTIVEYVKKTPVSATYQLRTANMFELNTTNGDIYVATDPSLEFDNTYTMGVCIYSRRKEACKNVTINFDGCFLTPNCNDQSITTFSDQQFLLEKFYGCFQTPNCNNQSITTFSDQHGIGDILFNMTYSNPTAHFTAKSSEWQNLEFRKVSSTLDVAAIDLQGVIRTTGNVTVWPDYPHSTHTFVVNVSNPGHSCSYTSQCTMTMQFSFTNWPISYVSLPASNDIHEDTDDRTLVHSIIVFDYNDPAHDNVTCEETANDNDTLLELYHDGNYSYNSWYIYKKACDDANCGYIEDNFLCTEKGCLNYDLEDQFTITINCKDAYGSETGDAVFTLNILENKAPTFTNTPTTVTLESDRISSLVKVISLFYSDDEKETLDYNFTVTPASPSLFTLDSRGNYYNDPANVTTTVYQWNLPNSSFTMDFCGRERRNIVCSSLTIDIRDYCGPTPNCTDDSVTVTDQFAIGAELFQIGVTGSGYTTLTYVILTQYTSLFTVNPSTGSVTSLASLPVTNPPNPTTYSIIGNVYDTAACDHAACSFSVTVNFTNFDISITNVNGVSKDIHEDTTSAVTLLTIQTSDNSNNDGVSCEVDDAASTPANNSIFFAVETDTNSNVFELISKEGPGFDYATTQTYTVVVTCEDNYGSSDTASMTVNILENQEPTMDNLNDGDMVNVDPMSVAIGYVIFTLQTSDDENDELDYSCSVDNSLNPLQCLSDGVVSLRRNLRIPEEDGYMFNTTLCIEDSVHNHTVCKTLSVNFTSSKTNPVLDNLPNSVSFPENSNVGTTLFTVTVEDPDVNDVHTFSVTVYPKTSSSTFLFDVNSGVLTLRDSLDYETLDSYVFLFSVRDQYLDGLEEKYLTFNVTNVNEAPVLALNQTTFTTIEQSAGYKVATLTYTCTDVDKGQTMNLSITSGSQMNYFSLESSTGIITYAQDWDFENVVVPPQTTTLEITCDDGNGLSDSLNIVINISPVNEFNPVLSITSADIIIYDNQTLLDPLFVVTATDNDYGDDGIFDFSVVGDGKGSRDFRMSSTGQLLLKNYIDWNYKYTWEFTVIVSDGESEPRWSYVRVTVTYIAPDPVIPTKEKARCILCTGIGKAVVGTLCAEAFIILLFIMHCCCRMNACEVCQLIPKPRLQTLNDLKKFNNGDHKADPYADDEEMFQRALPLKKPPEQYNYDSPVQVSLEPPDAAEYLPPGAIVNLAHIPERYAHAQRESALKVKADVHPTNNNLRYRGDGSVYYFSKNDEAIPEPNVQIKIDRLFKTPDKDTLYGFNSTNAKKRTTTDTLEDPLEF